jgi:two-component system sensor histidine kinase UhpB
MKVMEPKPVSIPRRLLAANAAVLVLALLLLALTPVTVSAPIGAAELAVLVAGGAALLAINWALVWVMMMGRREAERLETSRAVLAGQEGERLRVARELHDEVGQGLIAITLMAERAAAESSPEAAAKFTAIADKLLFYLDELRRIAHELRPETLDDLGLVNALDALCNGVGADRGVVVDRDLYGRFDGLTGEQELVLYRVAQEALTNAARHADASRVSLRLAERRKELTLEVLDDGRGVAAPSGDGVGIQGMRERARLVGGSFEIGPNAGSGTRVKLVVPLEEVG